MTKNEALEECLRITQDSDKISAVKDVLANDIDIDDLQLLDLAHHFVDKCVHEN